MLVSEIGADPSVEARQGLAPNDPVAPTAEWLHAVTEHQALALVGHLPFLDRLTSLLVAGNEDAQVAHFRMSGLVKLEQKENRDGFAVVWAIPPDPALADRCQPGTGRPVPQGRNSCQRTSVEHVRT